MSAEDNTYYLEEVEVNQEDGDPTEYDEVDEDFSEDEEEDFGVVLKQMRNTKGQLDDGPPRSPRSAHSATQGAQVTKKATVVDDFIRNFLIKLDMSRTLDTFNTEWYEKSEAGELNKEDIGVVADIYQRNEELDDQVKRLRKEVQKAHNIADKARGTWDKFRKERDFHRMHHRRVVQEKNVLIRDMKRLKQHYSTFEPALQAMRGKYEVAMKDKMIMRLEKDRVSSKVSTLQTQIKSYESMRLDDEGSNKPLPVPMAVGGGPPVPTKTQRKEKTNRKTKAARSPKNNDTPFPPRDNTRNTAEYTGPMIPLDKFKLQKTFRGHKAAITGLALHPTKDYVATASDDREWKMWAMPRGELIMSGSGHKDWIGALDFHPKGHLLSTASGDGTVKIWDFNKESATVTLADHQQAVWDCAFDSFNGDFLVSGSMDQTARLWDVATGKCRKTFRGHVDSVNSIVFQPTTTNVCTGSGDKTVSLWDIRSGLCIQTFYGHDNAVLSCTFSHNGDSIASSDSDGVIKVWDVRMVSERLAINNGKPSAPINDVKFDRSGTQLVAASDSSKHGVTVYSLTDTSADIKCQFNTAFEGPVHALALDPSGKFMMCAGEEAFRLFGQ